MNTEFETKVVDINPQEIIERLRELGAQEKPEVLLKRYVYDFPSDNIEWIRLRTNGEKTTLTYKYKVLGNTNVGETVEIEVEVSDFEKTAQIFSKLKFKQVFYQESKSHIFTLNNIEFSLDTWPMLDPILEVEGADHEKVEEGLKLLGLQGKDIGDKDIKRIYQEKGIDLHSYKELKF